MIERAVDRAWTVATSTWLLATFAVAVLALLLVSLVAEQTSLGAAVEPAVLRAQLPGVAAVGDIVHSLVFVVAALGLSAALVLGAVDRMLTGRRVGLRRAADVCVRVSLAVTVVLVLAQAFLFRSVTLPLAPGETALLPTLEATLMAPVTGWLPQEGLFGTLEVAPRLAGGELVGPFGDQDRPSDAALAPDADQVELGAGSAVDVQGLRLEVAPEPPAWAGRVRVASNGVQATSPFLQSGQSWEAAAVPVEAPPVVAVDRVIPDFDPAVPIARQPLSGPPSHPAAVVTLYQGGELLGSRALAPGEQVVLGGVTVLLEGFAPLLQVSVSRGGNWRAAAAAAAAAVVLCAGVWVVAVLRGRRPPPGGGGDRSRDSGPSR